MSKADSAIAEYMRIRRYVLTLIQKADGKSIPLPSILELSELFQVSRPTVSRAMKALTDEGYVIGRRGIGSFTNPAKSSRMLRDQPMIGLLVGDGMNVHFDHYLSRVLGNLMMQISAIPAVVHLLTLNSQKADNVYRSIRGEQLDAIVWHGMPKELEEVRARLIESGLPVIVSSDGAESFGPGSARMGYRELGYECGKALIAEGRKNLVFLPAAVSWMCPLPEIIRAYDEAGIVLNSNLFLSDPATCLEEFRKLLALGVPVDAVFNAVYTRGEVSDILNEFQVDLVDCCRLIESTLGIGNRERFCGFTFEFPFEKHAEQVASLLKTSLSGKALPECEIVSKIQLSTLNQGVGYEIHQGKAKQTREYPFHAD